MSATITSQSVPTGFHNANTGFQLFNAEQFTRASASRQQTTNLSITTAQGDIITLSMNASTEITRTTYDRFGRTSNEQIYVHQDSLTVENTREFSIQVQGDLNRHELKDLKKVIKQVDKIVRDLLKGDLNHAIKHAMKLGNLKSFASLEANIEVRQSFSLEQLQLVSRQSLPSSVIEESLLPESTPSDIPPNHIEEPTSVTDIPVESSTSQAVQPADVQDPAELTTTAQDNLNIPDDVEVSPKSISSFIDRLRNQLTESGIERIKLLPPLNKAFSDIIRDLSKEHRSESPILGITKLIHSELVDSLNDEREHDTEALLTS